MAVVTFLHDLGDVPLIKATDSASSTLLSTERVKVSVVVIVVTVFICAAVAVVAATASAVVVVVCAAVDVAALARDGMCWTRVCTSSPYTGLSHHIRAVSGES